MAFRFRITQPEFLFDVHDATAQQVEEPIPVYGFLGEWKNFSHLVIVVGADLWTINREEVEEILQSAVNDSSQEAAEDLGDNSLHVWFQYKGTDQAFLAKLVAWDKSGRGKK